MKPTRVEKWRVGRVNVGDRRSGGRQLVAVGAGRAGRDAAQQPSDWVGG